VDVDNLRELREKPLSLHKGNVLGGTTNPRRPTDARWLVSLPLLGGFSLDDGVGGHGREFILSDDQSFTTYIPSLDLPPTEWSSATFRGTPIEEGLRVKASDIIRDNASLSLSGIVVFNNSLTIILRKPNSNPETFSHCPRDSPAGESSKRVSLYFGEFLSQILRSSFSEGVRFEITLWRLVVSTAVAFPKDFTGLSF
jgi:hypothetical protein